MDETEQREIGELITRLWGLASQLDDLRDMADRIGPGEVRVRLERARNEANAIGNALRQRLIAGPAPATPGRNPLPAELKLPKHPPPSPPPSGRPLGPLLGHRYDIKATSDDPTLPRWQPRKYDLSP